MDYDFKNVKQGYSSHYNQFNGAGCFYTPTIGSGDLESYLHELSKEDIRITEEQGEVNTYYLSEEELKKYK